MKPSLGDGDFENILISPDDSPAGSPQNSTTKKQAGGRYVHMAQTYEAVSRSHKNLKSFKENNNNFNNESLVFPPPTVQIDLLDEQNRPMFEARLSKMDMVRMSTLSERIRVDQHPLAQSSTIRASVIDWVATFKKLPQFPATVSELVTSGTFYMIMEEIEPDYFNELSYDVLPKNNEEVNQLTHMNLKKIYHHMML